MAISYKAGEWNRLHLSTLDFSLSFPLFSPFTAWNFSERGQKENANACRMPSSCLGIGGVFLALD